MARAIALAREKRAAGRCRLDVEAEDVLEVGEAVVAAEAEIVAEEGEHQGEGHRLGDDRQVDAGDPAPEGEPAEDEGERAGHQHDHEQGVREEVEAVPGERQLLPVEEDHEVGELGIAVDAAAADLAHEVHAHGVAAEREERAMAERKDAAVTPRPGRPRARAERRSEYLPNSETT